MKALSISTSVSRQAGGVFDSNYRIHRELARLPQTEVVIVGVRDRFSDQDAKMWAPVEVRTFPGLGLVNFGYAIGMRSFLEESGADVIHSHGIWQYLSIAVRGWHERTRKPYIVSPHGMLDQWAINRSSWKKKVVWEWYERVHLENAACIRCLCESEAESVRRLGIQTPICVIPNGTEPLDPQVAAGPSPFPWKDRRVLLYLGRIHAKKGLTDLIAAWKSLDHSRNEWALAIVGWGEAQDETNLRELIAGAENIAFLGAKFDREKLDCFQHASGFILPSLSEGLPMAVLEAWANSLPVLMTEACHLPEGFLGRAAVRLEPGPSGIMKGLQEFFLLSDGDRKEMGLRGRALVESKFTTRGVAVAFREVYAWMLGEAMHRSGCGNNDDDAAAKVVRPNRSGCCRFGLLLARRGNGLSEHDPHGG